MSSKQILSMGTCRITALTRFSLSSEYWMRLSSLAAGTAGQGTRFRMSDAEADPCTCNCFSLWVWAWAAAEWIKFVAFLSISLYASSSGTSRWLLKRLSEFFVASPADIQTRGYLIWIWCPHVTFTSQDGCVCLSFTDGPQEHQKPAPNSHC